MFCSPFRRRRRRRVEEGEERQLTREEAWHLYLAKLEEEANYFSVSEREEEPDICTCHTCIVSIRWRNLSSPLLSSPSSHTDSQHIHRN